MINALAIKVFVAAIRAILTRKVDPSCVCKLADGTHHLQKYPRKKAKKSEAIEVMSAYDRVEGPRVKKYPTVAEEIRDAKEILPDFNPAEEDIWPTIDTTHIRKEPEGPQINDKPAYPETGGDIPDGDQ